MTPTPSIAARLRALARANNTTLGPGKINAELLAIAEEVGRLAVVARRAVADCPYDDDLSVYGACCELADALAKEGK